MAKNILLIMLDQMNAGWMSSLSPMLVETPHMDRIAAEGVSFSRAACNSPLCAPSRAALASGLYPSRLGVLDNFENYPLHVPTYYQHLRDHGYRVGVVGKTDLHKPEHYYGVGGNRPVMYQLGFTDPMDMEGKMSAGQFNREALFPSAGQKKQAIDFSKLAPLGPYQEFLMREGQMETFYSDYARRMQDKAVHHSAVSPLDVKYNQETFIAENAANFIRNAGTDTPWHLFVSFVGPHDPWDAPEEYYRRYADRTYPPALQDDMLGKPSWIQARRKQHSSGMTKEAENEVKRHYAGMIHMIDDRIGEILDELDRTGQRANTTIILTADHGEMMGAHGLFTKFVMYEDALRIPLVISDPDFTPRRDRSTLAELIDLFPTILDIAGAPFDRHAIDGKSLLPVLHNESTPHKVLQYSQLRNCRMVFDGRYKYIENCNDRGELYDLQSDPDELVNIYGESPAVVRELTVKMRKNYLRMW